MSIEALYQERCAGQGGAMHHDIIEHLPTLRMLADRCESIVEFGTRTGNSTVAFLASSASEVFSYDLNPPQFEVPPDVAPKWRFYQADTSQLPDIQSCDMLFIDTLHNYEQVKAELRHANYRVRRYLAFHDTMLFGMRDEQGNGPGIMSAVVEFLADNRSWHVYRHYQNNNGLTVLWRSDCSGDLIP